MGGGGVLKSLEAMLILKDGTILQGSGFGARTTRMGELVFNTSMIGYQECLTDPSYAGQILISTYPLIGNYGINDSSFESDRIQAAGYVVKEICDEPDHAQCVKTIGEFLEEHGCPGIFNVDTRFLVRRLRTHGVMPALITVGTGRPNVKKLMDGLVFDYGEMDFIKGPGQ